MGGHQAAHLDPPDVQARILADTLERWVHHGRPIFHRDLQRRDQARQESEAVRMRIRGSAARQEWFKQLIHLAGGKQERIAEAKSFAGALGSPKMARGRARETHPFLSSNPAT